MPLLDTATEWRAIPPDGRSQIPAVLVLILQVSCLEVLHVFLAIKDPTEVCSLSGQGKF